MSTELIKSEYSRIQRLIDFATTDEGSGKLGTLIVESRGNTKYCYECHYENGKRIRKQYLGRPGSDAVRNYCSRKYRAALIQRLDHNRKTLERYEASVLSTDPVSIYANLPAACNKLFSEAFIDKRYEELKSWASDEYAKNNAPFPKAKHFAADGTRVRSKGEGIEYNLLLDKAIPFRYDSLMEFKDASGYAKVLSPDFLIKCYDGSYVILEHLGMIGDKRYAMDYGEKCYWYIQQGFVPGKNLLVTSDDADGGTDSQAISAVVERIEQLFWAY